MVFAYISTYMVYGLTTADNLSIGYKPDNIMYKHTGMNALASKLTYVFNTAQVRVTQCIYWFIKSCGIY